MVLVAIVNRRETGRLELRGGSRCTRVLFQEGVPTQLLAGEVEPSRCRPMDRLVTLARWRHARASFERHGAASHLGRGRAELATPAVFRALRVTFSGEEIANLLAPSAKQPIAGCSDDCDLLAYGFTAPEMKAVQMAPTQTLERLAAQLGVLGVSVEEVHRGVFLALSAGILVLAGYGTETDWVESLAVPAEVAISNQATVPSSRSAHLQGASARW